MELFVWVENFRELNKTEFVQQRIVRASEGRSGNFIYVDT